MDAVLWDMGVPFMLAVRPLKRRTRLVFRRRNRIRLIALFVVLAQTLAPALASVRVAEGHWLLDIICAGAGSLSAQAQAEILAHYRDLLGFENDEQHTAGVHCLACLPGSASVLPGPDFASLGTVPYTSSYLAPPVVEAASTDGCGPPLGQRGPPALLGS